VQPVAPRNFVEVDPRSPDQILQMELLHQSWANVTNACWTCGNRLCPDLETYYENKIDVDPNDPGFLIFHDEVSEISRAVTGQPLGRS
jgi:hypothetical protein